MLCNLVVQHLAAHDREQQQESSIGGPDRDPDPNKLTTQHNKHSRLSRKAEKVKGTAIDFSFITLWKKLKAKDTYKQKKATSDDPLYRFQIHSLLTLCFLQF